MIISKRYLTAFTDDSAPETRVTAIGKDGKTLFQLQIRHCKTGIDFYLDVERFKGEEVKFITDEGEFNFDGEAESIPDYSEAQRFRPKLHYTAPYGWLNDPNGLIYLNGEYHIFCQHNPLGTAWGNMHWYHSVTKDFISFKHIGNALFPEGTGTMFSGSALCDTENVSGLGKNAILLFYTDADYKNGFSQGLAYSFDGIHFTKYAGNPIVPNIKGENRDPKVVFVPEMSCFVMALYLDGDEYCLLKSDNLTDWKLFQSIRINGDAECPDLYFLEKSKKWILSGASDYYIVGHFDKNGFIPEQEPLQFFEELDGRISYAAQSFSGLKDRALRLTWENISPNKRQCFCGQLSAPQEISLVTLGDGKMRLKAGLCKVFESKLSVIIKAASGSIDIPSCAYVADITFGSDVLMNVDGAELSVNTKKNAISFKDKKIPLSLSGKRNIRLVADKMNVEIFADDGLIFSCIKHICNSERRNLSVFGKNAEVTVSILK